MFMRTLDSSHETISQTMADIIDSADGVFGEPRVEDKERFVRAKLGAQIEWRENNGISYSFPITLRAPLPALERWANIFFQFDTASDTYDNITDVDRALDKNKAFTLAWMSRIKDVIDSGVKLNVYWIGGPQAALTPFFRWEYKPDPFHLLVEQQVYYKTDDGLGGVTALQVSRKLTEDSFLRFVSTAKYYQELTGVDLNNAFIYRRPFFFNSYLSCELGTDNNTSHPSPPAEDNDKAYAYLRMVGKILRPWMEYELRPEIFSPYYGDDRLEFGFKVIFRYVYQHYLSGT